MVRHFLAYTMALFVLAGCSATVELPAVSERHPANPNATAAPAPEVSDLLSVGERVAAPPAAPPTGGMGHMHHMPGMEGMQ